MSADGRRLCSLALCDNECMPGRRFCGDRCLDAAVNGALVKAELRGLRAPSLPSAPLLEVARVRVLERGDEANDVQLAAFLGVPRRSVWRWRHGDRIKAALADRLAVRCGVHPTALWPEWVSEVVG